MKNMRAILMPIAIVLGILIPQAHGQVLGPHPARELTGHQIGLVVARGLEHHFVVETGDVLHVRADGARVDVFHHLRAGRRSVRHP